MICKITLLSKLYYFIGLLFVITLLVACGDHDSNGGTTPENIFSINFPQPASYTYEQSEITVKGKVENPSDIESIRIFDNEDNLLVEASIDMSSAWSARVPLNKIDNDFIAQGKGKTGAVQQLSFTVKKLPVITRNKISSFDVSANGEELYLRSGQSLYKYNTLTGKQSEVYTANGDEERISSSIGLDSSNNAVVAYIGSSLLPHPLSTSSLPEKCCLSINLMTKEKLKYSIESVNYNNIGGINESGSIRILGSLFYDNTTSTLYGSGLDDFPSFRLVIYRINILTGQLEALAESLNGEQFPGNASSRYPIGGFAVNHAQNQLFYTTGNSIALYSLSTGEHSLWSSFDNQDYPGFMIKGLLLKDNALIVPLYNIDTREYKVVSVDRFSKARTVLSTQSIEVEPHTSEVHLSSTNSMYFASTESVDKINLGTGELSNALSEISIGIGPSLPIQAPLVRGGEDIFYSTNDELIKINVANGNRSTISSLTKGSGPIWNHINDIQIDPSRNLAYVAGFYSYVLNGNSLSKPALFSIDLDTGSREIVIDSDSRFNEIKINSGGDKLIALTDRSLGEIDLSLGTYSPITETEGTFGELSVNFESNRAYIFVPPGEILEIDLNTGVKSPFLSLRDDDVPSGYTIIPIVDFAIDTAQERLLASTPGEVYSIDLNTKEVKLIKKAELAYFDHISFDQSTNSILGFGAGAVTLTEADSGNQIIIAR